MATDTKPKPVKLDLRKEHRGLLSPSAKEATVVDVPDLLFLMVDGVIEAGSGPSESESFHHSMEAMYGVGYGLKFMSKRRPSNPIDFTVMALEALWSTGTDVFATTARVPWSYTLLMMQPDHITPEMFAEAVAAARAKRPTPAFDTMRLARWQEGMCIQMMHIGPYAEEPKTLEVMHRYAAGKGLRLHGRHHEIYLGDPRRAAPDKLKTILRHPVAPA